MGIVQRQTLKNAIVNYSGILVGGLSTLFIYPLDWELYGEIQFALSTAMLLSAFFSLGSHSLVNKFFPYFKSNDIKGFLSLLFIYAFINIVLISILLYLFRVPFTSLLDFGGFNSEQINDNILIIAPLAILFVLIAVLRAHCFNFSRIVLPDAITNFSLKLLIPVLVLLGYFSFITFNTVGWILIAYHILIVFTLLYYIKVLNGLDFKGGVLKRVKKHKHIEMIRYMLYGAMNHVGNILVYKIDLVMIGLLLPINQVGYYSIFLFLSVVIEIPTKAIYQITAPMVSKSFEENNLQEVNKLYKSASANLYTIGIALFSIIWLNMELFFKVMTKGEDLVIYKVIILILGLTKIIDMITSINFHIISYSRYFRMNTLFIIILAISNIVLNYFLINKYGLIGAAFATGISMLLFNSLKTLFIVFKYKMHPFNWKLIIISLFLIGMVILPLMLPKVFSYPIYSLLITAGFLTLFIFTVYQLQVTVEINKIINKYWKKYFN